MEEVGPAVQGGVIPRCRGGPEVGVGPPMRTHPPPYITGPIPLPTTRDPPSFLHISQGGWVARCRGGGDLGGGGDLAGGVDPAVWRRWVPQCRGGWSHGVGGVPK